MAVYDINRILMPDAPSEYTDDTVADQAAFVECDRAIGPFGQGAQDDTDS